MREIKDILRALRAEHEMTQDDLARQIGVQKATISHYEAGTRYPKRDTLQAIADLFNVSTDFLTGRSTRTELVVNDEERLLIEAYRHADPGIREAVRRVLNIKEKTAAAGDDSAAM